jgi:hypothetical protein
VVQSGRFGSGAAELGRLSAWLRQQDLAEAAMENTVRRSIGSRCGWNWSRTYASIWPKLYIPGRIHNQGARVIVAGAS